MINNRSIEIEKHWRDKASTWIQVYSVAGIEKQMFPSLQQ